MSTDEKNAFKVESVAGEAVEPKPTKKTVDKNKKTSKYDAMKLKELKELCKEKELKCSGSKKELVERLENDDAQEGSSNHSEAPSVASSPLAASPNILSNPSTPEQQQMSVEGSPAGQTPMSLASHLSLGEIDENESLRAATPKAKTPKKSKKASSPKNPYSGMKLAEIKEKCKAKGLPTKGNKMELIESLME